jgi:quinol monooxygenase YgiN
MPAKIVMKLHYGERNSCRISSTVYNPFAYTSPQMSHRRRSTMLKNMLLLVCMSLLLVVGVAAQEMKMESKQSGKATVVVTHEVKDYAAWKKGFDAHGAFRAKAGFKVTGVYCDVKNPNMVTVVGEFASAAAADAFLTSADLKETMAKVGVVGKPEIKVLTAAAK